MVRTKQPREDRPYAQFADRFQDWVLAWRVRNPRMPYTQRAAARSMDMDETTLSKIGRGQLLPTDEQCHAIAAYFAIDVQEVAQLVAQEKHNAIKSRLV